MTRTTRLRVLIELGRLRSWGRHQARRVGGVLSYARAMASMQAAKRLGLRVSANSQINRRNVGVLLPLAEALPQAGIAGWQPILTIPHGNAADQPDLILQPCMLADAYAALERVLDLFDAHGVGVWPGNNLGYFGPLEHRLRRRQNPLAHYKGCQAGTSILGIESDGTIKACPTRAREGHSPGSVRDVECSIWDQDCGRGEKCVPWANDGSSVLNASICRPIHPQPGVAGEPCRAEEGVASGIDDCDAQSVCFDVDPDTLEGVCAAFCEGDENAPTCEAKTQHCVISNEASSRCAWTRATRSARRVTRDAAASRRNRTGSCACDPTPSRSASPASACPPARRAPAALR